MLAYSCFTQLMKRMSQNFPNGGAMDTHFANMRSLIQVGVFLRTQRMLVPLLWTITTDCPGQNTFTGSLSKNNAETTNIYASFMSSFVRHTKKSLAIFFLKPSFCICISVVFFFTYIPPECFLPFMSCAINWGFCVVCTLIAVLSKE